jgi:hypothetical protein
LCSFTQVHQTQKKNRHTQQPKEEEEEEENKGMNAME